MLALTLPSFSLNSIDIHAFTGSLQTKPEKARYNIEEPVIQGYFSQRAEIFFGYFSHHETESILYMKVGLPDGLHLKSRTSLQGLHQAR